MLGLYILIELHRRSELDARLSELIQEQRRIQFEICQVQAQFGGILFRLKTLLEKIYGRVA